MSRIKSNGSIYILYFIGKIFLFEWLCTYASPTLTSSIAKENRHDLNCHHFHISYRTFEPFVLRIRLDKTKQNLKVTRQCHYYKDL